MSAKKLTNHYLYWFVDENIITITIIQSISMTIHFYKAAFASGKIQLQKSKDCCSTFHCDVSFLNLAWSKTPLKNILTFFVIHHFFITGSIKAFQIVLYIAFNPFIFTVKLNCISRLNNFIFTMHHRSKTDIRIMFVFLVC